jgi:serine/threonine protein kinase
MLPWPPSGCRDIKLDNTLLDGEPEPTIKLCDFQFAKYWGWPQMTRMTTHLGTAVYMAPGEARNAPWLPTCIPAWCSAALASCFSIKTTLRSAALRTCVLSLQS